MAPVRAVIYARVSSAQQRERQTIASQLSTLPERIAARGWTLVAPAETYVDDGYTAKEGHLDERAAFRRLLADAAARRFDVVVVVGVNRLTRSGRLAERYEILGALQDAGVMVSENGDDPRAVDALDVQLKAIVGAEENKQRAAACARGKREAAKRGKCPGKRPWGLGYSKDRDEWFVDEPRAEFVREVFRRVVAGESGASIARDFLARNVERPQGGRWYPACVRHLARQTAYRGTWEGLRGIPIAVPRLIDDDTWYAAQASLTAGKLRGLRRTRHVYLLEGIAVCGACGAPIRIHSATRGNSRRHAYYVCDARLWPGATRCTLPIFRVDDADPRLWAALLDVASRPDLLAEAANADRDEAAVWRDDLPKWEGRLAQLAQVEEGVLQRYRRGLVSEGALDGELERIARERRMVEQQVAVARSRAALADASAREVAAVGEALRGRAVVALTVEEQREMVRALVPGRGAYVVTLRADRTIEVVVRMALGDSEVAVRLVA